MNFNNLSDVCFIYPILFGTFKMKTVTSQIFDCHYESLVILRSNLQYLPRVYANKKNWYF